MMDEIEVVARALADEHGETNFDDRDKDIREEIRRYWYRQAGAAIAALDEYRWAKVDQRLAEDRARVDAPYIRDPSA